MPTFTFTLIVEGLEVVRIAGARAWGPANARFPRPLMTDFPRSLPRSRDRRSDSGSLS